MTSLNRSLSIFMTALYLGSVSAPVASGAVATTPEVRMLETVLALQGSQLPQDQMRQQLSDTMTEYFSSAKPTGQRERLQQALVDLGIYNEKQATNLMIDSQNSALTAQQIERIAGLHPMGAQFSSCTLETAGIVLGVVGSAAFLVSLVSPHYPDSEAGLVGPCDNGLPCDQADYYRSNSTREHQMIGSGIAVAIGAILYMVSAGSCNN